MPRYLVGIDNGSQSSKVTVFDEHGVVVASGRCPLRAYSTPRPGAVEHPDDDLWDSIGVAARAAMKEFTAAGGDLDNIAGVGLCTIRFCRALLRVDGSLASPVLSWMDDRLGRPYEQHDHAVAHVTTSSGYITHRLTGEYRDTSANYQGQWPIDVGTWQWSDDDSVIRRFGVCREQLFELVAPGELLGLVTASAAAHTGLPVGLPVVATANDKAVEALGSGLASPTTLLISLGTYITSMTIGDSSRPDAVDFWSNFASVPGEYLYESGGIRRGMWTVSWFRDLLGAAERADCEANGESVEERLGREAALVPAGSDGLLTVLDWLAPADATWRRGSVLGFDGRHGRGHMYRSILEGIAFTMKQKADLMAQELAVSFDRVVVSGGGSVSPVLTQIICDVFGLPVSRPTTTDGAGLGAAICAAVGLGVHPDFNAAQEAMVRTADVFDPSPGDAGIYARLVGLHAEVTAATDPLYERLAALSQ